MPTLEKTAIMRQGSRAAALGLLLLTCSVALGQSVEEADMTCQDRDMSSCSTQEGCVACTLGLRWTKANFCFDAAVAAKLPSSTLPFPLLPTARDERTIDNTTELTHPSSPGRALQVRGRHAGAGRGGEVNRRPAFCGCRPMLGPEEGLVRERLAVRLVRVRRGAVGVLHCGAGSAAAASGVLLPPALGGGVRLLRSRCNACAYVRWRMMWHVRGLWRLRLRQGCCTTPAHRRVPCCERCAMLLI